MSFPCVDIRHDRVCVRNKRTIVAAKFYQGIEGATNKAGEAQVAFINASRAYTTLLAGIAAAQAADSNLED